MKGTFFQKPLEFNLRVDGEAWNQGDTIQGQLLVKNHGSTPPSGPVSVHLAFGQLRKVHAKTAGAFKILASSVLPEGAGEFSWKFETDRNCPISDNTSSPFLLYGAGDQVDSLGQLQLVFRPCVIFENFVKVLETDFRFVRKSNKNSKGSVEVKFAPPDGKAFAMVESLALSYRFDAETLQLHYTFNVKKIDAAAASLETSKQKKEYRQELTRQQYLTPSGRTNHESIGEAIRQALGQVEAKLVF